MSDTMTTISTERTLIINTDMMTTISTERTLIINTDMTYNISASKPEAGMAMLVATVLVFVVMAMVICRYASYQRGTYHTHEDQRLAREDVILLKNAPAFQDTLDEEED